MTMNGRTVIVTGGFGTLGRAVGAMMASRGATVALVDRLEFCPPLDGSHSGANLICVSSVDLASMSATQSAFGALAERIGRIDVLVNVAGGFRFETLEGGALETWDLMYQMNLRSAVTASKAALTYFTANGDGRIINIGAAAAARAAAGMGSYAAAKAGVAKLTESLAEELRARRITVNAILPSIIDTPANRADMPNADFSTWVPPAAIAKVIMFLASADAEAVTGALIPVGRA